VTKSSWPYRIIRALPLVACLAPALASASSWSVSQVDNYADVGKYASLAVDANNALYVSYFDTNGYLRYATNKSGSWDKQQVVPSVYAAGTAIALNSSGNPQINFYYNASSSNKGIRNTNFNGSAWSTPSNILPGTNYTPTSDASTSIFHKSGYTYMTFVKSGSLMYAKNTAANQYTSWNSTTLDSNSGSGLNNSIVVDSSGYVHAVGFNSSNNTLYYYTNSSGSFVRSTVEGPSSNTLGKWCSLAIDSTNTLHVAFMETNGSPLSNGIRYRYKSPGSSWSSEQFVADAGTAGGYATLEVDSIGKVHISYYYYTGSGNGKLRYATNLTGAWTSEDVDAPSGTTVGNYSSLAVDSDETVSIAYYDASNSALKIATRKAITTAPTSVSFGTVDRGFQSGVSSLTVNNNLPVDQVLGAVSKSGSNPGDFGIVSDACSNVQLPPQGSCTVVLNFAPPAEATRSSSRSANVTLPMTSPYPESLALALSGNVSANFLVTASAGNGGSISPTKTAIAPGATVSFSIAPGAGFSVGSVVADGNTLLTPPYTLANVNADHSVIASLVSPIRILESSTYYGSLQSALSAMNPGWTIQAQPTIPAGDLTLDRDVEVNLSGGYDSTFSSQSGSTAIPGSITINSGTLAVDNVTVQ
jgi:hypothetical protein